MDSGTYMQDMKKRKAYHFCKNWKAWQKKSNCVKRIRNIKKALNRPGKVLTMTSYDHLCKECKKVRSFEAQGWGKDEKPLKCGGE